MPLNDKKIIAILLEQCTSLEQRCPGYREEVVDVVSDIIEYERQHRVQGTNIQQKINDKISSAGKLLAEHRARKTQ